MAAYDDFAWFYNHYWNEDFHALAFPILERIWLARVPAGSRILDVCCGTGYLAGMLVGRGYRVEGVDVSAEMIAYARRNVPGALVCLTGSSGMLPLAQRALVLGSPLMPNCDTKLRTVR